MKKSITFLAVPAFLFLLFSGFTGKNSVQTSVPPQNDAALIGRAHSAVGACLGAEHSGGAEIDAAVEITGICFVSGYNKRVNFWRSIRCNQMPCPMLPTILVAWVDFDCEGNITGSWCLN